MQIRELTLIIVFLITTAITIGLFYLAMNRSRFSLILVLVWLALQTILSLSGFFTTTHTIPPRILLFVLPPVIIIFILFGSARGRHFIDQVNPAALCLIFIIRVPVELVLYGLFLNKQVPLGMTFAGGNYDIFSGLTAPFIYYYGFVKKQLSKKTILVWNFICLGLLLSVVIQAILSSPSPFQRLNFNQPNLAILYFPYAFLPSVIVPIVLFSQLAISRNLLLSINKKPSLNKTDYQGG